MSGEEAKKQVELLLGAIDARAVEVVNAMVALGIPHPVALAAVSGRSFKLALEGLFLAGKTNREIKELFRGLLPSARKQFTEDEKKAKADRPRIVLPGEAH